VLKWPTNLVLCDSITFCESGANIARKPTGKFVTRWS